MKLFHTFLGFIGILYQNRYMIKSMAMRDLKAKYVGSAFGLTWAVLYPLVQVAIYGVVFGLFFGARPDPVYNTDNFFVYLICGLIPWQFFSQSVSQSTQTVVSNRNLVKKAVGFHPEILPVITVLTNIISHLIALFVLLVILSIFTPDKLSFCVPFVFLYLCIIAVFCVGVGWIVAGLNVYLKDVQQVISLIMMAWLYFTPIFYSPTIIPDAVKPLWKLNPLYHLVVGYRHALIGGMVLPWTDLLYMTAFSFMTLAVGGLVFRKLKPGFGEVL